MKMPVEGGDNTYKISVLTSSTTVVLNDLKFLIRVVITEKGPLVSALQLKSLSTST